MAFVSSFLPNTAVFQCLHAFSSLMYEYMHRHTMKGVIFVSHLHSLTAGLTDQTYIQNFVRSRSYNPYDNVCFEGASRVDQEIKHFRRELPSMGPGLCCYCFYSHEEEN